MEYGHRGAARVLFAAAGGPSIDDPAAWERETRADPLANGDPV
jgi:hypothetical protein